MDGTAPEHLTARPETRTCDVLVMGGGPGGAATAAFLAREGLQVVLVEAERHPRFHVGESLLPHSMPVLEDLGVLDDVKRIGVHKPGAAFVSPCGTREVAFNFARALLEGPGHAYQVHRAEFDEVLFRRAGALGVELHEETMADVRDLRAADARVRTTGPDGRQIDWTTRFLVDASGRSTVLSKRLDQKRPDPRNTSAAIFGHFTDVPRADGPEGGNIRIHLTDPGWMWQIPLTGGITSIGLVAPGDYMKARVGGIQAFFDAHVARHPGMAAALADASVARPLTATGNFSYRATEAAGTSHVKVGDAYGFLDPIFSTGVHLALLGARDASAAVLGALASPRKRDRVLEAYDRAAHARMTYVSWFVYAIHDPSFRHLMLYPKDVLGVERAVISLLAGDFRPRLTLRSRIALFKAIRYMHAILPRSEPRAAPHAA